MSNSGRYTRFECPHQLQYVLTSDEAIIGSRFRLTLSPSLHGRGSSGLLLRNRPEHPYHPHCAPYKLLEEDPDCSHGLMTGFTRPIALQVQKHHPASLRPSLVLIWGIVLIHALVSCGRLLLPLTRWSVQTNRKGLPNLLFFYLARAPACVDSVVIQFVSCSCAVTRVRYDTLDVLLTWFGGNADRLIRRVWEQRLDRQQSGCAR